MKGETRWWLHVLGESQQDRARECLGALAYQSGETPQQWHGSNLGKLMPPTRRREEVK